MKFLHISDIHFNPKDDGLATRDLREKFSKYVQEKNITDIDEVFFTGDFRHALKQIDQPEDEVAQNAVDFLRYIASCVGVTDDQNIHIVPGNHDLSREVNTDTNNKILKTIYKNYDRDDGRFSGYARKNESSLNYLRNRFGFFEKCTMLLKNQIWEGFKKEPIHRIVPSSNSSAYSILYLNTAIASGYDKFKHKLLIGTDDFEKALKQTSRDLVIVLAHNRLSHLISDEQDIIKNIIKDNKTPVLWLCGDAHKAQYDNSYNITCITAGCMIQQNGTEASFNVGQFTKYTGLVIDAQGESIFDLLDLEKCSEEKKKLIDEYRD